MSAGEINQRRLRYFKEVYERGSIRAAADALNTASSVLTRQLKLLEREMEVPLFDRGASGVTPTQAAMALMEYSRACESERDLLEIALQRLSGLHVGSVRIVTSEGFIKELMSEVLADFIMAYPKLTVSLSVCPVNDVVTEVEDGTAPSLQSAAVAQD
jgi:DNA-binding transcriptional LysR family regulator